MRNTSLFPPSGFVLLLFSFTSSQAQVTNKYSVGMNAGTLIYIGDLSPWRTGSWKTPGFVWGLTGHRTIRPAIAARLDISFGKLRGDEAKYTSPEYRAYRAFAFNSTVTEIVLSAEWTPFVTRTKLSPYAFAGIGYSSMRIQRDYSRFNAEYFSTEPSLAENLQRDIATSLPRGTAVFPVGLGLRYGLNERYSLHAEAAHRFTRNDYVDGFSYSGNPKLKDGYTKYSLGIRLALGNKDPYACPPMRY